MSVKHITIPRELIYANGLSENRIIIFSYLYIRKGLDDISCFTLNEMIEWCGLKPSRNKDRINDKYLSTIYSLIQIGYLEKKEVLTGIKHNSLLFKGKISDTGFAIIYLDEIYKIINFKKEIENKNIETSRVTAAKLLLLLSYIRVNINSGTDNPHCCYRLNKYIAKDLGLNEQNILLLIKILDELKIIKHFQPEPTRTLESGERIQVHTLPKIFADYYKYVKGENGELIIDIEYDPDAEIEKQIKLLKQLPIKK